MIPFKTMEVSIQCAPGPRCYKRVTRLGKTHWRNYKREVPGGSTFIDLMAERQEQARRRMDQLLTDVWG